MPGGWVDVNQSIKTNTEKEVKEEAGLDVKAVRLIALQDRNLHNVPPYAYNVCKAFVLCEVTGGRFQSNIDEIPALAEEKNNKEQIAMCFTAYLDENWKVPFD